MPYLPGCLSPGVLNELCDAEVKAAKGFHDRAFTTSSQGGATLSGSGVQWIRCLMIRSGGVRHDVGQR